MPVKDAVPRAMVRFGVLAEITVIRAAAASCARQSSTRQPRRVADGTSPPAMTRTGGRGTCRLRAAAGYESAAAKPITSLASQTATTTQRP